MNNAISWFEIPAIDLARATQFYESIFGIEMHTMSMMGMEMAGFPGEPGNGKVSGGLMKSDMHKPSVDGAIIYLNANPDMQPVLDKIESAGGKIAMPKTKISDDIGYMAFFIDTEGNKVGLHSQK